MEAAFRPALGSRARASDFEDAVYKVTQALVAEMDHGANIGGWKSTERSAYMAESSEIHHISREDAIKLGEARNQEAILSMESGEFYNYPEVLVAEDTKYDDDGKKDIVFAVPPKPISQMTEAEIRAMARDLFRAINAKQDKSS